MPTIVAAFIYAPLALTFVIYGGAMFVYYMGVCRDAKTPSEVKESTKSLLVGAFLFMIGLCMAGAWFARPESPWLGIMVGGGFAAAILTAYYWIFVKLVLGKKVKTK